MNLLEQIKNLGTDLEKKRKDMLSEVEAAAEKYNAEHLVNFRFQKQSEYTQLADEYEKKKMDLIDQYIIKLYTDSKTEATGEELKQFNEICKILDNIGEFSEFELEAITHEIKDNIILMGMLERKIEKMNLVSSGEKVHEHFKIFDGLQEKRKSIRGIDDVKQFKDRWLFSHTLQESNMGIQWGMSLKMLGESLI